MLEKLVSITYLDEVHNLSVNIYGHKREKPTYMLYRAVSVYMSALEKGIPNNSPRAFVLTVIKRKASDKLVALYGNDVEKIAAVEHVDGFSYSDFEEFKRLTTNNKSYQYTSTMEEAMKLYHGRIA
jgi:hypothetical protein